MSLLNSAKGSVDGIRQLHRQINDFVGAIEKHMKEVESYL